MAEPIPRLYFGKRSAGSAPAPASPPEAEAVEAAPEVKTEAVAIKVSTVEAAPIKKKESVTVKVIAPVEVDNPMLDDVTPQAPTDAAEVGRGTSKSSSKTKRRVSRFQMTEELFEILQWIDKARYSSSDQVAVYGDVAGRSARKMLGKLEAHGYLKRKQFAGFPMVYFLSPAAKDLLGSETKAVDEATGPGFIRHTLGVGWVMLGLLKSQVAWATSAEKALGRTVLLDDFVSEPELLRATHKRYGEAMTALERQAKRDGRKTYVAKWEGWEALAKDLAGVTLTEEFDGDALWAWPLYNTGRKPHYPDLILRLPRDASGNPRSLAFEIERSVKPHSVDEILRSYEGQLSGSWDTATNPRYHSCAWVCGNKKVKELLTSRVEEQSGSHIINTLAALIKWKEPYLAELELAASTTTAAHKAARAKHFWHVTSQHVASACGCGITCRARYGQFKTKQEALALAEELA